MWQPVLDSREVPVPSVKPGTSGIISEARGASLRSGEQSATMAPTEHLGDLSKRPEKQCHFPRRYMAEEGQAAGELRQV